MDLRAMKTGLQTVLKAPSTLLAAQVGPKASLEKRTRPTVAAVQPR
jgi:hypothetical protein